MITACITNSFGLTVPSIKPASRWIYVISCSSAQSSVDAKLLIGLTDQTFSLWYETALGKQDGKSFHRFSFLFTDIWLNSYPSSLSTRMPTKWRPVILRLYWDPICCGLIPNRECPHPSHTAVKISCSLLFIERQTRSSWSWASNGSQKFMYTLCISDAYPDTILPIYPGLGLVWVFI